MMEHAELARLCAEAYLPGSSVEIGDDLAANITTRSDGAVVVAFRGTANAAGWYRDIDVMPRAHPMIGYCHRGFLTGACALLQKIDLGNPPRVILTGHSLGGALAVVFGALRLAVADRVDELVTFGAPRAGYSKLAEIWTGATAPGYPKPSITLYRNGNDPVPHVPLRLIAFPYSHIRTPTRIGSPDPAEPWNCHSIRMYAAYLADLLEPKEPSDVEPG